MTLRLTKKRQQILDVLKKQSGTLSATDIHKALPDVDLVTIYRNLDLFTQEKIIKQFHLTSGEAQYEYQAEPHHHAICENCKRIIHFTAPDTKLKKLLGVTNFTVDEIEITVKGTCR